MLYYCIFAIYLNIYLLYLCSHFMPKIIRISGIITGCSWSFFSACPRRGPSIASWVSSLSLLNKIALAHPINSQWQKKKKIDGADDPINLLLEQALTRQRDEMMENFAHILQRLPIASGASSSGGHFGGTSPFKVQVNLIFMYLKDR